MNDCKKCRAETPCGETCAHCGAKLTKTGERLTLRVERRSIRDWFCWNRALRVALPVYLLVGAFFVLVEACTRGELGVRMLFSGGFLGTMLELLALLLGLIGLVLLLQGTALVQITLDKNGARELVCLRQPSTLRLLAYGASRSSVAALGEEPVPPGYTAVQRHALLWADVRRVSEWPETCTLLLYRPGWWLALPLRLPAREYEEACAYTFKRCHVKKTGKRKKIA